MDGTPVDLTMTQKGNKLEGMADAGGMRRFPVKFKKNEEVAALWYCEFLLTSAQNYKGMFTVIGIMFCGIAVELYFFRKVELLQKIGKPDFLYDSSSFVPAGNFW